MHGLFKTASINQIFSVITKRLIILFLWKSREQVYHFLLCNRFIQLGSQRRQTCVLMDEMKRTLPLLSSNYFLNNFKCF